MKAAGEGSSPQRGAELPPSPPTPHPPPPHPPRATGGAQPGDSRAQRNPWKTLNTSARPAPTGRRGLADSVPRLTATGTRRSRAHFRLSWTFRSLMQRGVRRTTFQDAARVTMTPPHLSRPEGDRPPRRSRAPSVLSGGAGGGSPGVSDHDSFLNRVPFAGSGGCSIRIG
jgi:hypothetical protein